MGWENVRARPLLERKGEDHKAPQDSYDQYEQHAAARRGQQEDEDVFEARTGFAGRNTLR